MNDESELNYEWEPIPEPGAGSEPSREEGPEENVSELPYYFDNMFPISPVSDCESSTDSERSEENCNYDFPLSIPKSNDEIRGFDSSESSGSYDGSEFTTMTEGSNTEMPSLETAMIPIPGSKQPAGGLPTQPEEPAKEQVCGESPEHQNGSHETGVVTTPLERELMLSSKAEKKSDSEREPMRWRGGSGSPPPRGRSDRSRSRSWERRSTTRRSRSKSRRSRSRGRERDRSRAYRNRSPPPRSRYDRDRKMRSWSKSPPPRSRSRSPPSKLRNRYRNRSRSRSHSPYDSTTPVGTPTQDSNHGDDARGHQTLQSVVHSKKRRCRDFDEKGFCMRGEMCPFDHGNDPVVLEDVRQVLSFSAPGLPSQTLETSVPPVVTPVMTLHHRPPLNIAEYNPDAPSMEPRMWLKQPFRSTVGHRGGMLMHRGGLIRAPINFPAHHQRELISVPVMEGQKRPQYYNSALNQMKRQCPPDFSNGMKQMPPGKYARFDSSNLSREQAGNRTLQLKKVPRNLNTIAHLHNHFYKFGNIVNIQVSYEGDPEAALITFASHSEAFVAYRSTEAILNNRFIRVFWHIPDKDSKQEDISSLGRTSVKERLGAPVNTRNMALVKVDHDPTEKVLISPSNIVRTVYNPTAIEKKQTLSAHKRMIVETTFSNPNFQGAQNTIKKKQEEKRKEALKLTQHLCKKKHELIEKLLLHQKQLIDKLEKGNITPEQRTEILSTIQGFQENIDMIRKDIKTVVAKPNNNAVKVSPQLVKRTREETQKQILDAELDLFNQQQEGKDTTELQKRVLELKMKAHNLGLLANNGVLRLSRGGARFRGGRGRGSFNPHVTLDHRPTKLLVSGFESDDKAEVLDHFKNFGEVADHIWDEATPALVIQFKTRKDAETAMTKGRNFQDRLLSVTWFSSAQNMGMRSSRSVLLLNDSAMSDLLSEHDDEEEALRINLDQNEDFLLQDEEEEEDEERSWRR